MSKSGYSPHICYYASVLARAVQDDDDTFANLHDIVARRISSSATKIDEIERLAREYSDLPKHVLLKKIQWLEERGIKPLRGRKAPTTTEQTTDPPSDKAETCEELPETLSPSAEKDFFLDPALPLPLVYEPEHGSLTDICQKMEERKNPCFHVTKSQGDGNNNVQKADVARKSYEIGHKNGGGALTSSSDSKDNIPEYTVISLDDYDDYDVSSPVKFDFLQPSTRTNPRECHPFVEKGATIEMQEIKKEEAVDSTWNWDPKDKVEPEPKVDSSRDDSSSVKKKKKKKKPKKTDEPSAPTVPLTSEVDNTLTKPVSAAKSRSARRKKLVDAYKQKNEEAKQSESAPPEESEKKETKAEPAPRRKRTIREYKLNQQKEALEKSGKTLTESSKLTAAPCASYGSTSNASPIEEFEPLVSASGSQKNNGSEHKRPKREKKDSKNKSNKQKDGQKYSNQDRAHYKAKSEKKSNANKSEMHHGRETVVNTDGADSSLADSNDAQWPLLNQQLKHRDTYVPLSHESTGGAEVPIQKAGMSYASKVRNSLQLDSAGGSLASSCEDSSSSSSSNGTREYNVGAERSLSPSSLPDMERKAVQDNAEQASKGDGASHSQVESPAEFEPCANIENVLRCDGQENHDLDFMPNIGVTTSSNDFDTFSSGPASAGDVGDVVLPNTIEILLKNEWGLDFINENIVSEKTDDDANNSAVNVTGASSMLDFKFAGSESPEPEPGTNTDSREPLTASRSEPENLSDGPTRAAAQRKPAFDHQSALKFIWKEWLSISEGKK